LVAVAAKTDKDQVLSLIPLLRLAADQVVEMAVVEMVDRVVVVEAIMAHNLEERVFTLDPHI
jgi:hypothetical protein